MKNSWESKKILAYGKRFSVFTSIMLVLLFAFSCSNLIMNDGGSLIIAVPGARAASASSYTIELTGTSGAPQRKTVAGGSSVQFDDLAPDTYNIVVEGMDASGAVVFYGTSSATVTAGATASATVKLGAVANDLSSLQQAVTAGGIVYIGSDINVDSTLTVNTDVTLLPAYKNVTLMKAGDIDLISVTAGKLTVGGNDYTITLDGDSSNNTSTKSLIQVNAVGCTVTLDKNSVVMNNAGTGVTIEGKDYNNKAYLYLHSGTIKSNQSGGVSLGSYTEFVMNDGVINGNKLNSQTSGGAGVNVGSSIFTMKGGTISDNEVTGDGGAIRVISRGSFTMDGGRIEGNSATGNGGGVSVTSGTFIMNGGSITDNKVIGETPLGHGVYFSDGPSGDLKFSGNPVIDENNDVYYEVWNEIKISGPLNGATPIATITFSDYSEGTQVLQAENGVDLAAMVEKFAVTPNPDGTQWFINTEGKLQEGVCVSDFASLENAISAGGTVYITKAITMERTLDINKEVTLLSTTQSVVLTGLNPGNLFTVRTGGDFTIGDADHAITLDGNKKSSQIIQVNGGTVSLANGTITNAYASGVYINAGGRFNMSGGSITANTATNGGGVYVDANGTFNMTGGSITGNTATNGGGGVYVNTGATFTMSGSAIVNEDNDVYLSANTTISVSGDLSGDIVARITPYTYETNTADDVFVLSGSIGSNYGKFTVTSASNGQKYQIGSDGKLGISVM